MREFITEAAPVFPRFPRFPLLVSLPDGGSAIAGDLFDVTLQGYGADDFAVIVNRTYGFAKRREQQYRIHRQQLLG